MNKILLLFLFLATGSSGWAKVIRVGKNRLVSSVKQGLLMAARFDTVIVEKGMYKEGNLVVTKPLTLIGEGLPVLDGDRKFEVLSIKSSFVTVKGFRIQHSSYATLDDPGGIKVYNSHHVTITNNELHDNFFGIYIQYSQHCLIRSNTITGTRTEEQQIGNGIHCWKSDSLQIVANRISGQRDGIYFEFVTHSVIWRNISESNLRYGLHFMFSNSDAYITNLFRKNGAGVAVMFTHDVKMFNNTFEQNWGDAAYGLLLKEISDSYISGNKFRQNTSGIYMEGTNRILVEKNTFESNGWGMKIQASCMENRISENNFLGNTFDVATNGSLVLNTFDSNYWDKYEGYDLDKNQVGDVPFRPLSLFSVIVENNPPAMLLYRSFMISLIDKSEKILPSLTPENFIDLRPRMHAFRI